MNGKKTVPGIREEIQDKKGLTAHLEPPTHRRRKVTPRLSVFGNWFPQREQNIGRKVPENPLDVWVGCGPSPEASLPDPGPWDAARSEPSPAARCGTVDVLPGVTGRLRKPR